MTRGASTILPVSNTPYPPHQGQDPYDPLNQPYDPLGQPSSYGNQSPYGQPGPYPNPGMGFPGGAPGFQAPYGVDPVSGRPYSDKSKVAAGLMQLFLGGFGVGRFYTGHIGIGVAQLLTCGGLGIWSLIDGIMMLTGSVDDADGRPLRN